MKTSNKAIADINALNAFNAERELSMVVRELFAMNGIDETMLSKEVEINALKDKIALIQNEQKGLRVDKSERLKKLNVMIKDLHKHGVKFIEGKGMSKCPHRIQVKNMLAESSLAQKTKDNILAAIVFAVNNGKGYDVHWQTKLAQERKIEQARQQGKSDKSSDKSSDKPNATPPATPPATPSTTPSTTTPPATPNTTALEKANLIHWCGAMFEATEQIYKATKKRASSADGETYEQDFALLASAFDEAMDLLKSIADREIELYKNK